MARKIERSVGRGQVVRPDFGSRIRGSNPPPQPTLTRMAMAYELNCFQATQPPLAEEIAQNMRVPIYDAEVRASPRVNLRPGKERAGATVHHPAHRPPVNDTLMERLIMIDAMKRASAHGSPPCSSTMERASGRKGTAGPISAKLVAACWSGGCTSARLDLHAGQIQASQRPVITSSRPGHHRLLGKRTQDPVSCRRRGRVERARAIAKRLNAGRPSSTAARQPESRWHALQGDVKDKDAVASRHDRHRGEASCRRWAPASARAPRIPSCGVHRRPLRPAWSASGLPARGDVVAILPVSRKSARALHRLRWRRLGEAIRRIHDGILLALGV